MTSKSSNTKNEALHMQFSILNWHTDDCKSEFILEYHMRLFTDLMAMIILTFFLNADIDAVF